MAIIVDKVQKRQDIALSCKALVLENGIKNLTISQIAKTAGVGKGTIYDYFNNKEDLVFEIVNFLMQKHRTHLEKEIAAANSTKDKIKAFAHFFYDEKEIELRGFYKEFISIALSSPNEEMIAFNTECADYYQCWFSEIIQEGIDKGELIEHAQKLAKGLFVSAEGMFISASSKDDLDTLEQDLNDFIDAVFVLMEVK